MRVLSVEEILLLQRKLIERTGGSQGVRDQGLVASAVNRASATFDGCDLYGTVEHKIAATIYGLVNNHGFIDGNKRIGIAVMLLLARLNGIQLRYRQNELVELGLGIADGRIDESGIIEWINIHTI